MPTRQSHLRRLSNLENKLRDRTRTIYVSGAEEVSTQELAATLQVIEECKLWEFLPNVFSALTPTQQSNIRAGKSMFGNEF